MAGDSLRALMRLDQTFSMAPKKMIFFRSSIITSNDEVVKIMGWDKMSQFCHPYKYDFPLDSRSLAKDLDLARAQVTEHLYKQPIQRPGSTSSQEDYIPYIQDELAPEGHLPSEKYHDVLGLTKLTGNSVLITAGEVKNNAHVNSVKLWYQLLAQINKPFVDASDPMDFITSGSYSIATVLQKDLLVNESVVSKEEIVNAVLYKHISLAVNPIQYYQLKAALQNPLVQKKVLSFMEKASVEGIDIQLWDVIPTFEEIPVGAKLEYLSLIEYGNILV